MCIAVLGTTCCSAVSDQCHREHKRKMSSLHLPSLHYKHTSMCFQTGFLKLSLGQDDGVAEPGVTTTGQPPESSRSHQPSLLTILTSEETQLKHHIVDPDLHSKTVLRVCCESLQLMFPMCLSSAATALSVSPEAGSAAGCLAEQTQCHSPP